MRTLLNDMGMDLLVSCPICGLEDKFIEHTFLHYPGMRLIWRMVGNQPWEGDKSYWQGPFLDTTSQSLAEAGGQIAYIAYQVDFCWTTWYSRLRLYPHIGYLRELFVWLRSIIISILLACPLKFQSLGTSMLPRQRPGGFFLFLESPSSKVYQDKFWCQHSGCQGRRWVCYLGFGWQAIRVWKLLSLWAIYPRNQA